MHCHTNLESVKADNDGNGKPLVRWHSPRCQTLLQDGSTIA
jgi:hypothetical protein